MKGEYGEPTSEASGPNSDQGLTKKSRIHILHEFYRKIAFINQNSERPQSANTCDRIGFGILILVEQFLMYSAVGWVFYPGNDKENKSNERVIVFDDFKIKPFLIVNYFLFSIGMALEIFVHLKINRWAKLRKQFSKKKTAFYTVIFILAMLPVLGFIVRRYQKGENFSDIMYNYHLTPLFSIIFVIVGLFISYRIGHARCKCHVSKLQKENEEEAIYVVKHNP